MNKHLVKVIAGASTLLMAFSAMSAPMEGIAQDLFQPALTASAVDIAKNGLKYEVVTRNGKQVARIVGYEGQESVVIPDVIAGYQVVEIAAHAFSSNAKILDVDCSRAKYLTTIGTCAFTWCSKLKSIILPASVTTIQSSAFQCCKALTTVRIAANSKLTDIQYSAFATCENLTYFYSGNESCANQISLPASVKNIGSYAFDGCKKIKSLYFHDENINEVRTNAFPYTANFQIKFASLDKVTEDPMVSHPDTWVTVDSTRYRVNYADINDKSKGAIIKEIVPGKTSITVPSKVTINGTSQTVTQLGDCFLIDNKTVTALYLPDSITDIGCKLCTGSTALKTLKLPKNIRHIGHTSIYGCTSLADIQYTGTELQEIEYQSLWCTKWLDDYEKNYPKADAVMIGNYLYKYLGDRHSGNNNSRIDLNCTSVWTGGSTKGTYVQRPIYHIGYHAFDTCKGVANANLKNVKTIHSDAFRLCENLESIYNTEQLLDIGNNVFSEKTIERIRAAATDRRYVMIGTVFYRWAGGSSDKTIDLRNYKVTNICSDALKGNKAVTTVYLPNSNPRVSYRAFAETNVKNLYLGSTRFTYNNVMNNSTMKAFYEKNYDGLDCCPATKEDFIKPLCKKIFSEIGLTFYGGVNNSLTPLQQTAIAGKVYRYLGSHLRYSDINGDSGEYTLYSFKGVCRHAARAASYMLNMAGLETVNNYGVAHQFTSVKIAGKWMHMDVCDTWQNIQRLFLKTSAEFAKADSGNHTVLSKSENDYSLYCYSMCPKAASDVENQPMGDCNKDGVVNSTDLDLMYNHLYQASKNAAYRDDFSDLNGDGKVNGVDLILLEDKLHK